MLKLRILYTIFYFAVGSSIMYFGELFNISGISGEVIGKIFALGSLATMVTQPILGFFCR